MARNSKAFWERTTLSTGRVLQSLQSIGVDADTFEGEYKAVKTQRKSTKARCAALEAENEELRAMLGDRHPIDDL